MRLRGGGGRGGGGGGLTLYLHEVAPYLAVVAVTRDAGDEGGDTPEQQQQSSPEQLAAAAARAWDGDDASPATASPSVAALAGSALRLLQPLPRSGLSVPHQATIDFNIAAVSRALASLFEKVATSASAAKTAAALPAQAFR